jgi:hypothetical protein
MLAVTDIDRPDVNGVQPKMYAIESLAFEELYTDVFSDQLIPSLHIECNDNLLSSVIITGSFDPRESWSGGYWENSHYFQFFITAKDGKRYYEAGQPVTVELNRKSYKIAAKFRKFTGTPEKAIAKIKQWILDNK